MVNIRLLTSILLVLIALQSHHAWSQTYGLALHGGAGYMTPESLGPEKSKAYKDALQIALEIGYSTLKKGESSETAIINVISFLEDNELFNSGRGSVLNAEGQVEMDASIMLGKDLSAGAVAGVTTTKHPIKAAALVMNESKHVMMAGDGAEKFSKQNKLEMEEPSYFITDEKRESLKKMQERNSQELDKDQYKGGKGPSDVLNSKFGTLGVVALDKDGNLASGTSTGGMSNKMYNRIGDSPVIGAGTYADNATCAGSCTGHGEYFIRLAVAHEVSALMKHREWDVDKAASHVIHVELENLGGKGGLIALDRRGNVSAPLNTPGMFRGWKLSDGREEVKMFKD